MDFEFIFDYLPQNLALMVLLFFGGIYFLIKVCLGGEGERNLPKLIQWGLGIVTAIVILIGLLGIIQISFISGNGPDMVESPEVQTLEQQAVQVVVDYFNYISEGQLDEAYDLLDPYLQDHSSFLRPKWDEYVSTTTFVIKTAKNAGGNGNIYKVKVELSITPNEGTERPGYREICVVHNPTEETLIIKSINDESVNCW